MYIISNQLMEHLEEEYMKERERKEEMIMELNFDSALT